MKVKILGNSYENGKRVASQEVTFDKSDDLYTLANLQKQYESVSAQLENSLDEASKTHLEKERERLKTEIAKQEEFLAGYTL